MTGRPRRADVAALYDLGVDAYDSLWSPVILPPAQQVVASFELDAGSLVLDVGTGTGALSPKSSGRVGTVTWTRESTLHAHEIWDATLTAAGAPPLPSPRVDTGLDSADGIVALLTGAGLQPTRVWLEPLSHQWEPSTYWQMATGSGLNRTRLQRIDADARRGVLDRARERLETLRREDYAWSGEVVCAVATKPD